MGGAWAEPIPERELRGNKHDVTPFLVSTMSENHRPAQPTIDIGQQQIGKVYAQAMLAAAGSTDAADHLLDELGQLVNELFAKAPGLEQMLGSPRISVDEKIGLLDKILGDRASSGLLKFLKVTCTHGRLDCLRAIYAEACSLQNQHKGIVEVDLVTAQETDAEMLRQVREALESKMSAQVDLQTAIDPSLIGGVMIRVGDKVLDASIKRQLSLLREETVTKAGQSIRAHAERFAS